MSTHPPVKTWKITAVLADAGLAFEKAGQPVSGASAALSPVEYLLLSAAGCMALSLKAAAIALALPLTAIRVTAAGTKPATPPSRLDAVELDVAVLPAVSRATAERLVADAQQMCTVTNTLRDSAALAVRVSDSSSGEAPHSAALTGKRP